MRIHALFFVPCFLAVAAFAQAPDERRCQEGEAESCGRIAMAAFPDGPGPKDLPRAVTYNLRACAAGSPETPYCRAAGMGAEIVQQDPAARAKLAAALGDMEKACEGGRMNECNALGITRLFGTRGERDPEGAKAMFARACEGGVATACANLGDLLAKGGREERAQAVALFGKACAGNAAWTCKVAGVAHAQGVSGEKDTVQAARLFKRGCDGNDKRSCMLLFSLYQQDPAGARELFRKACGSDFKQCNEYESLIKGAEAAAAMRGAPR